MPRTGVSWWIAITLLFAPASSYSGEWEIQVVDPGGGGKYSALRMDTLGNAHASYTNEQLHELRYAFWDHLLNRWFTMKLDDHCNGFISIALDTQQHPHISYPEYGTGRLKYTHFDGATWKTEAIPLPVKLIEYYTSIALNTRGQPIITFYEILNKTSPDYVLHLRAVKFNGQYWELTTVDGTPGSGKFNSIAVGHDGNPHLAYANVRAETASLRYARWSGTSWIPQILQGAERPQPSYSVNMVLGTDDVPNITYTDAVNRLIKYATIRDGKWQFEIVDRIAEAAFPDRNGIALDSEGNPYISYSDTGLGMLKVARRQANRWITETVEKHFTGFTPAIQATDKEVIVLYFDAISNSLKCARQSVQPQITVKQDRRETISQAPGR